MLSASGLSLDSTLGRMLSQFSCVLDMIPRMSETRLTATNRPPLAPPYFLLSFQSSK